MVVDEDLLNRWILRKNCPVLKSPQKRSKAQRTHRAGVGKVVDEDEEDGLEVVGPHVHVSVVPRHQQQLQQL